MSVPDTLKKEKAEVRALMKKIRAGLPESLRHDHNRLILGHLFGLDEVISANTVFIYISYGNEVDTHAVIQRMLKEEKSIAVPKIIDAEHMIAVPFTTWKDFKLDKMGILTAATNIPFAGSLDIAITPGLGFTIGGDRIGFGRGYYDQWFRTNTVKTRIALAYEAQLMEHLPVGGDDEPIDIIVTEKRVIRVIKPPAG